MCFERHVTIEYQPNRRIVNSTLSRALVQCHKIAREGDDLHSKSPSTDRHRPHQRRSNTLPESSRTFLPPRLSKCISHRLVPLVLAKAIALHLTLDHIKRIARYPKSFTRKATIERNLVTRDILTLDTVALHVLIHQILKRQKPHSISLRFTIQRHCLATVEAVENSSVGGKFLNTIPRPPVQPRLTMRLRLQPYPHMLYRPRQYTISKPSESAGTVVLCIRQRRRFPIAA